MNKEFLHMQKLAGLITESEYQRKKEFLNETKVDMWTLQDVIANKHVGGKAPTTADLRVGLSMVPKKYYGSFGEIKEKIGKITKIEGNKVFITDLKGEEHQYDTDSLIHVYNAGL